jgi:6-pyruvoyltetrahydropterin/6-carboxytetrahydropterin synthase
VIRLTRRYRFAASHRLHQPVFSEEENRRIYGKCNNPFGHGHNYVLSVTVAGVPDPVSGRVADPKALDRFIEKNVIRAFDHRNLNIEAEEFAGGGAPPTTECLALAIRDRLLRDWSLAFPEGAPRLDRISLEETPNNKFELRCP